MSRCINAGRPGCHGRLCRAAHSSLRQLPVVRYAGLTADPSTQPQDGWVCALVSHSSGRTGASDIPGTLGGQRPLHLTAAAGSLEPPLVSGDLISVNEQTYRVSSVCRSDVLTAELIPTEEAM